MRFYRLAIVGLTFLVSCGKQAADGDANAASGRNSGVGVENADRDPLPETPIVPIVDPSPSAIIGPAVGNVPRPGEVADYLLGNYVCKPEAKELPSGPFKLTAFGCRIFRDEDGLIKLGRTSQGLASLHGEIRKPSEKGFLLSGIFKFPGNGLSLRIEMKRIPGREITYAGQGLGTLNNGKNNRVEFSLVVEKI